MKRLTYLLISLCCLAVQASAQTPQQLHDDLPVVFPWTLSPDVEVFNRDNLYERINGAAPLFLENNFQEMTSMEYLQGDDYITIQTYRHATPEDAFGMYASERSADMAHYPGIGGEAQGDGYGVYFFSGCMYVKITASNETEAINQTMLDIAKVLAEKIDPAAAYPALFTFLPKEGLIPHTEAYITQNYIGHEFLKPVYVADYNWNNRKIQLFVIDGKTSEGAQRILADYFRFTKQTDAFSEGKLLIKDRYNGAIPVIWKGKYITGVLPADGKDLPEEIYGFMDLPLAN